MSAHVIFASYGNDSVALIQWASTRLAGELVFVVYSETGWAAEWWAERVDRGEAWVRSLGFTPVRTLSEGMESLVRRKKAWPRGGGGKFQFCTQALKKEPALAFLETVDPDREAVCYVGIRREESANRADFPEWVEESAEHGGRQLHAPLVRMREAERDALIVPTPLTRLSHRSKECWPCVNARVPELRQLDDARLHRIAELEAEMGTNGAGNARVMFSPKRHHGAVGIVEVVRQADRGTRDMFAGCSAGWCGA